MATVELSPNFKKEAKKLIKKYASLKTELAVLFSELEKKPDLGMPLGDNIYKIRMAVASKGKGKSGGTRVLTYYKISNSVVLLFSIYNKGDRNNIPDSEIQHLLKGYK